MKFRDAFFVFRYLLRAKEWYIIADTERDHIKMAHINLNKVIHHVNQECADAAGCFNALDEAKKILEGEN